MSAKKKKVAGKVAKKKAKPAKGAGGRAALAKAHAAKTKTKASKKSAAGKPAKKSAAKKPAKKLAAKKGAPKKARAKAAAPKKAVAAKKAAAPKKAARAKPQPKYSPVTRRDGTGHLDPKYAAKLRELSEEENPKDDDRAFDKDALSDELGEEFVETVTSGEDEGAELRDEPVTEESGGPFTVTSGSTEFAGDVDASNPEGATREPFPRS